MESTGYLSDEFDLSELPDLVEDYDFSNSKNGDSHSPSTSEDGPTTPISTPRRGLLSNQKRRPASFALSCCSPDLEGYSGVQCISPVSKRSSLVRNLPLSPIEVLPNEIVQKIAAGVDSDVDLCNLNLSSPTFPSTINEDESEVWRTRFLVRYDYPIVDGPLDFSTAYKLRRLVLKNFISFAGGMTRRTEIQLEVVRDMVIETHFNPKPWLPPPTVSRNLKAFASPTMSPWIITFLSSSFPGITEKSRYGKPESFFETVQLVLSHLLLSPKSPLSHLAASSRENYDLVHVYSFDQPLTTLYTALPIEETPPLPFHSKIFPNLKSPDPEPALQKYKLDTNALLHVRNFWHRHLIDDSHPVGEHTYADMMRDLGRIGRLPQEWNQALDSDIVISTQWLGHYSCLHPWPKARKDLEESQSCAEDWNHVDPMMLDLVTSNNYSDGFWPPAFSTIPVFDNTVPPPHISDDAEASLPGSTWSEQNFKDETKAPKAHCFPKANDEPIYIRGIAPFVDIRQHISEKESATDHASSWSPTTPTTNQQQAHDKFLKRHPFNTLRVRGVIHYIPPAATVENVPDAEEKAIPGWNRIVMVLYKPSAAYLINVLEHAKEDYGGVFGTEVTSLINTADIWTAGSGVSDGVGVGAAAESTMNVADGNGLSATNTVATSTSTATTAIPAGASAQSSIQAVHLPPQPQPGPIPSATAQPATTTTTTANQAPSLLSPTDLQTHLANRLHTLLTSTTSPFSSLTSLSPSYPSLHPPTTPTPSTPSTHLPSLIQTLEDAYIPPHYLSWDDGSIDFAYAYEGTILPGGKITMGRWWRCHGTDGIGPGWEVGTDGTGVEIGAEGAAGGDTDMVDADTGDSGVSTTEQGQGQGQAHDNGGEGDAGHEADTNGDGSDNDNGNTGRYRQLDRGPFVFWC